MVVVLVNFSVNGGGGFLVTSLCDSLVDDAGSNLLVDGGVMMTSLGPKVTVISFKLALFGKASCWTD